ncbi:MAG: ABC transporter permease [Candidatus Omnitrophota bacterium]|jgi:phospholipid/cholesterol/gamma-HCH transport system permease protein|nr:ABC transporter permease [Candidatus Omnitrophota bacterium]
MRNIIKTLGERSLNFFVYIGGIFNLLVSTVFQFFIPPFRRKEFVAQMFKIGILSLPIVFLVSLFTGMVLALQSAYQLTKMNAQIYIASLVALSVVRELGPVLTALVIAGRVGASITAEIGTMKVTEQIDALETLSANPVKYLVVPRFLALAIMLPLLTIYADFIGIIGGYLIGVYKLLIGATIYTKMTFDSLEFKDLFTGLFKSLIFAVVICIISCYEGFRTEGGAEGVGKATTLSVVTSFILIIAADCLFTAIFYFIFP